MIWSSNFWSVPMLELSPYAKATLRDYCKQRRRLIWKNRWSAFIAWIGKVTK